MKIGILTHPLKNNYGGILQNWALQQVLKSLGHEYSTLNWGIITYYYYFKSIIAVTVRKLQGIDLKYPNSIFKSKRRLRPFKKFIQTKIHTRNFKSLSHIFNKINNECFDAIIVGSDQVWRPKEIPEIETMFLDSLTITNCRKIAYAASFGTDSWEFNEIQTQRCSELIKNFDFVSIREGSGVKMCKTFLGYEEAYHVLDPVFLIEWDKYLNICSTISPKHNIMLAYILDPNNEIKRSISNLASKLGKNVVMISAEKNVGRNISIETWLSLFRDADYVITDSFHGTAFSLLSHTNVIVLSNPARGNARLNNILEEFNIENVFSTDTSHMEFKRIDWDSIENKLQERRRYSISLLERALQ